jgi:hypothetical protein
MTTNIRSIPIVAADGRRSGDGSVASVGAVARQSVAGVGAVARQNDNHETKTKQVLHDSYSMPFVMGFRLKARNSEGPFSCELQRAEQCEQE